MKKVKKAFTLLELIIVITVLGIIALMSFNTLMNLYQNYCGMAYSISLKGISR